MNSLRHDLLKKYRALPEADKLISYKNHNLRDKDYNRRLERCFFVFAIYLAAWKSKQHAPIAIIITASHNPPGYNGLKAESLDGELILNHKQVESILNNSQKFEQFLETSQFLSSEQEIDFFIGRDARTTSPILSSLIYQTLIQMEMKVVDLGLTTTPEFFSLSQYIYKSKQNHSEEMITNYFQQIENHFERALGELKEQGLKCEKKHLCFDFSNGVGAYSFKKYKFLQKYFFLSTINDQNFDQPNVQCGAEWLFKYYKEKRCFPEMNHYPECDQYYFFDGDCDRIIGRIKGESRLITGDDFSACFMKLGLYLMKQLNLDFSELSVVTVGNINSNLGVDLFLKTIGIHFQRTPVGMKHIFEEAKKHDYCAFFEANGHGCLFISEKLLKILFEKQHLWQARLLLAIYGLARNNSRGYAFHNMLILQFYFTLFQTNNANLFHPSYFFEEAFLLPHPQLFANSTSGIMALEKPQWLVSQIEKLKSAFPEDEIVVRRSDTEPKIRLTIQGDEERCLNIQKIVQPMIVAQINKK